MESCLSAGIRRLPYRMIDKKSPALSSLSAGILKHIRTIFFSVKEVFYERQFTVHHNPV